MQQQYRGYPAQMPQRSPHVANPRRAGIGPIMAQPPPGSHHTVAMTPAQLQQQAQAQAHATEQAKRRSTRPTDKTMPDGVDDIIIGDGVQKYNELRDLERRLDATITRKRLDIVDSVARNPKRFKTLRIWISNTVEDQAWQGSGLNVDNFDFSTALESSYRVKIEGRLLDDDDDDERDDEEAAKKRDDGADRMDTDATAKPKPAKPAGSKLGQRYRFSHFFRSLSVDFSERSRARNGAEQSVEWKKPERNPSSANLPAAADFDELTFKRNGDENVNIVINLYRYEDPERYALTPALSDIVDLQEATRQEVVQGLYEYIKLMGLQEDEEKRNFRCDDLLRLVVGKEAGWIPDLHAYINPHLRPLPPVQLAYTIRVDEEFHKNNPQPTIYDVRVAVDDPLKAKLLPFMQDPQYAAILKEVAVLDDRLATLIQGIAASKAKHQFFSSLATDPATFVRSWLSSQKRDLEVIMGEVGRGAGEEATGDEWRRGGGGRNSVWSTESARESVTLHLAKLLQQQHLQAAQQQVQQQGPR